MKLYFFPPIILQVFIWLTSRFIFAVFWRLETKGADKAEALSKGIIFASNHSSEFDAVLVRAALPFFSRHSPMFYISREKDFYEKERFGWRYYIYGGIFFKSLGAYPVYTGLKDYGKSLKNHIEILEDGGSVCIFPEGRTSGSHALLPAKGGVAYLAHQTGRPIVPVGISGLVKMNPRDFFFGRRRIVINYGAPIHPKKMYAEFEDKDSGDPYKKAAQFVMLKISELLEENKN